MLDIFVLSLLFVVVLSDNDAPLKIRLPQLRGGEGLSPAADTARPGRRIELAIDGTAKFEGEDVPAGDLDGRIAHAAADGRPVALAVETSEDGSGPLESFLQIQAAFSRNGLWDRTTVLLSRPRTPTSGDASPPARGHQP